MKDCNSSNYWKNSSPILYNDSQISWNSQDFSCESEDGKLSLKICHGQRLSEIQEKIVTLLCQLIDITDASVITLPSCLITAWGSKDKTVLEFLQFLLDQHCSLKTTVDGLVSSDFTLNTIFEVNYPDCCGDECIQGTSLKLVEHLEKILLCLCAQATRIDELENDVTELTTKYNSLNSQLTTLNSTVNSILLKTNCLEDC